MTAWAKCPQCGERIELTGNRMHCPKCGGRLDMSTVRFGQDKSPALAFAKRLARTVVLVALLAVLVLLIWPVPMQGAVGSEVDAEACYRKLSELYMAIQGDKPMERVVTEAEANAYLMGLLGSAEQESRAGLNMRSINLSFTETGIAVHILMQWRFLSLSQEVQGVPTAGGGAVGFVVRHVSIGHLPLPGVMHKRFAARLLPIFEQMERERYVLDRLSRMDLGDGRVRLLTGG